MLRRTVEAFAGRPVRVVIGPGQEALYHAAMGPDAPAPVTGGARRQDSVRLGLEALADEAPDFVLIHDAARPLGLACGDRAGDRSTGGRRRRRGAHAGGGRHASPQRRQELGDGAARRA